MMQATAELHQSALANQKKKFGEEIARLQVCLSVCDRLFIFGWLVAFFIYLLLSFINRTLKFRFLMRVLQHATELVKTAASRYDEYVNVKDLSDKISRALTAAKKDNDFIYHDRVPEIKDVEHIGKASLVKTTAIQTPLSQKFTGQNDAHMTILLFGFFWDISRFLCGKIQQIALFFVLFV